MPKSFTAVSVGIVVDTDDTHAAAAKVSEWLRTLFESKEHPEFLDFTVVHPLSGSEDLPPPRVWTMADEQALWPGRIFESEYVMFPPGLKTTTIVKTDGDEQLHASVREAESAIENMVINCLNNDDVTATVHHAKRRIPCNISVCVRLVTPGDES